MPPRVSSAVHREIKTRVAGTRHSSHPSRSGRVISSISLLADRFYHLRSHHISINNRTDPPCIHLSDIYPQSSMMVTYSLRRTFARLCAWAFFWIALVGFLVVTYARIGPPGELRSSEPSSITHVPPPLN